MFKIYLPYLSTHMTFHKFVFFPAILPWGFYANKPSKCFYFFSTVATHSTCLLKNNLELNNTFFFLLCGERETFENFAMKCWCCTLPGFEHSVQARHVFIDTQPSFFCAVGASQRVESSSNCLPGSSTCMQTITGL